MARSKDSGIITDADGSKIIDKRFRGERIYIRLGAVTHTEAIQRLARELEERRKALDYGTRPRRTFADAAAKFLTEHAIHKSRDGEDYARYVLQLTPFIGDLELYQIHDGTLKPFVNARRGIDTQSPAARKLQEITNVVRASETTINHALKTVRRILNLAATFWRDEHSGKTWLETAPLLTIAQENPNARPAYPINWSEQKLLLSELPAHLQQMTLFKVNTGTREQEVCRLRWDWEIQVPELDTSVFIVPWNFGGRHPNSGVKNRQDRVIVLNDVARSVIDGCRDVHRLYVFTWKKGPKGQPRPTATMNNTAWWDAVQRASARYEKELGEPAPEGFSRLRVHDLKHTFGRRLRAAGVSLETRKALLGQRTRTSRAFTRPPSFRNWLRQQIRLFLICVIRRPSHCCARGLENDVPANWHGFCRGKVTQNSRIPYDMSYGNRQGIDFWRARRDSNPQPPA